MKVVEIFNSIEGEGKRIGLPATFIRFFGCNMKCIYCDSVYACEGDDYKEMSIDEILQVVEEIGCPNITITGGEPLIQQGVTELLQKLSNKNYEINVETNGSIMPSFRHLNVFYTVDYKTHSSGMTDFVDTDIFETLCMRDVIKFVVGTEDDMEQAYEFMKTKTTAAYIYISPVFGQIEPTKLVRFVQDHKLWNWRVQVQLHKILWNPDMRGV